MNRTRKEDHLECGGKRSASPLWLGTVNRAGKRCRLRQSGICHRQDAARGRTGQGTIGVAVMGCDASFLGRPPAFRQTVFREEAAEAARAGALVAADEGVRRGARGGRAPPVSYGNEWRRRGVPSTGDRRTGAGGGRVNRSWRLMAVLLLFKSLSAPCSH